MSEGLLISDRDSSTWSGHVTLFRGQLATRPFESIEIDFGGAVDVLTRRFGAPSRPKAKAHGVYFLPCELRDAPLTGKTRERAVAAGGPDVGRMRSKAHCIAGALLKLDFDDLTGAQLRELGGRLTVSGLAGVLYPTWSCGTTSGNWRVRVMLFLDEPLAPDSYVCASRAVSEWLLPGAVDSTSHGLHQLAGVWMRPKHASTAGLAVVPGRLVNAAVAVELGRPPAKPRKAQKAIRAEDMGRLAQLEFHRLGKALPWVRCDDYAHWVRILSACADLAPMFGCASVTQLGELLSRQAEAERQALNADKRYDPSSIVEQFIAAGPTRTVAQALGVLHGIAIEAAQAAMLAGDRSADDYLHENARGAWRETELARRAAAGGGA